MKLVKKCDGEGKLNWLEKVLGKKTPYYDRCLVNNIKVMCEYIISYCNKKGIKIMIKIDGDICYEGQT